MVQTITIVTKMVDKVSGATKKIEKSIKTMRGGVEKTTQSMTGLTAKGKKINQTLTSTAIGITRFKMHLLSVMFFGMLIQRTFSRILRSAVTAFTKIMESSGFLGTSIQRLGVQFEYLKFIIGSALNTVLEPLMPTILGLIDAFTEFTQKHPGLISWIILLSLAVGTLLFLFGTLGLGIGGLTKAFPFLKVAISALLSPLGLIVLAFLLLIMVIPAARKLFFEMFTNVGKAIKNFGKLIIAVFKGDWELAKLYAIRVLINLLDAAGNFAGMIIQVFVEIGNWIFLGMISPLLTVLKLIDAVTGSNFAGKVISEVNQAKKALSAGVQREFGGSSVGILASNQAKIDALLASRGTGTNNENTNIGEVNLTVNTTEVVNAKELLNELSDELKRYK